MTRQAADYVIRRASTNVGGWYALVRTGATLDFVGRLGHYRQRQEAVNAAHRHRKAWLSIVADRKKVRRGDYLDGGGNRQRCMTDVVPAWFVEGRQPGATVVRRPIPLGGKRR